MAMPVPISAPAKPGDQRIFCSTGFASALRDIARAGADGVVDVNFGEVQPQAFSPPNRSVRC
jgi:hypothetical protein